MPTRRVALPSFEPVTLDDARLQCRVDDDSADTQIRRFISAAREMCEDELQRTVAATEWELRTDAFSRALRLDWPTVRSITHVQFLDAEGVLRTLDPQDYELDNACDVSPAWLVPAPGRAWPATAARVNAVRVRYAAGWETAEAVPDGIKTWILMHVAALYENPEAAGADLKPNPFLNGLINSSRVYA
jgi:uncharacterized phiE125 gp8 family phage protein